MASPFNSEIQMSHPNVDDLVESILRDFAKDSKLFTALDVSNAVKQTVPQVRHKEVRDIVRSMFSTLEREYDYARTPIKVTLEDNSQVDALLYHHIGDSWDLDVKYSDQQRSQRSLKGNVASSSSASINPLAYVTVNDSGKVTSVEIDDLGVKVSSSGSINVKAPDQAAVQVSVTSPKDMWDNLFNSKPLFPLK